MNIRSGERGHLKLAPTAAVSAITCWLLSVLKVTGSCGSGWSRRLSGVCPSIFWPLGICVQTENPDWPHCLISWDSWLKCQTPTPGVWLKPVCAAVVITCSCALLRVSSHQAWRRVFQLLSLCPLHRYRITKEWSSEFMAYDSSLAGKQPPPHVFSRALWSSARLPRCTALLPMQVLDPQCEWQHEC